MNPEPRQILRGPQDLRGNDGLPVVTQTYVILLKGKWAVVAVTKMVPFHPCPKQKFVNMNMEIQ